MKSNNDNQFLADFILDCVNNNKKTVLDICEMANTKIRDIETEINKIEQLRVEQNKYKNIIKQLSPNRTKNKEVSALLNIDSSAPITPYIKELCFRICNFVNEKTQTDPRSIMDGVANIEENFAVYSAIKWLNDQGIIKRIGPDRLITAGDNWNNRDSLHEN
jgi:uncharacterized protein YecE (DUF72 family)